MNRKCLNFVHMSSLMTKQSWKQCENLDWVGQLETGQTGYLLIHPRKFKLLWIILWTACNLKLLFTCYYHAQIQKVFSEGVQLFFKFMSGSQYH